MKQGDPGDAAYVILSGSADVVIETPQGDSIAIRHMMYISLSYDHRIIDGALGSTFLNAVSKELENFDVNRSI